MGSGDRKKKREGRRDRDGISPAILRALDHPVRRDILRALNARAESLSPAHLAKTMPPPLGTIIYHMRALQKLGLVRETGTRQVRGAEEHFFASNVSHNEKVTSILEDTEADDKTFRDQK